MLAYAVYILVLFVVLAFTKWLGLRLLFKWVSAKVKEKFKITLTVNKIHFTYLEGILLRKEGLFKIHIERIGLSSKWLNPLCNKPLTLFVGPTTVTLMLNCSSDEKQKGKKQAKLKDPVLVNMLAANMIRFCFQHVGAEFQNLSITSQFCDLTTNWSTDMTLKIETLSDSLCVEVDLSNSKLTTLHDEMPFLFISHELKIQTFITPGLNVSAMRHKLNIKKLHVDVSEDLVDFLLASKKRSKYTQPVEAVSDEFIIEEAGNDDIDKFISMLNILPQAMKCSIENFQIVYKLNDHRELRMDWNCVLSWQRLEHDQYQAALDILGFIINGTNHCKLLLFKQVTLKLDIYTDSREHKLQLNTKVDSCHFDFIYEELLNWKAHFLSLHKKHSVGDFTNRNAIVTKKRKSTWLSNFVFNADVSLENCSCDLYTTLGESLGSSLSTLYFGNVTLNIKDGIIGKKTLCCGISLNDVYCYMNVENILPENACTFPCQLEDDEPTCLPSSERHAWGRIFELGKISLQLDVQPGLINCKSKVTFISLEWSLAMGTSLINLLRRMKIKSFGQNTKEGKNEEHNARSFEVDAEVEVENINLFMIGDKEGGYNSLLFKLDTFNVATGDKTEPMMMEANGVVFTQLTELTQLKTGDVFFCSKSETYRNNLLVIPSVSACTKNFTNLVTFNVSIGVVNIDWTPNLHMALYEQITEVETCIQSINELDLLPKKVKDKNPNSSNVFEVKFSIASFALNMATAKDHTFALQSAGFAVDICGRDINIENSNIGLLFDGVEIFRFENVQAKQLQDKTLHHVRQDFQSLQVENKFWSVSAYNVCANFPYKFDFGESLEKFQAIVKMLKLLHKKPNPDDYVETLLPDLHIKLENVTVEFDDDPFEVRLGDNFLLLSDEIEQAIEREQKLEAKLNQIKSEKGALISGKKLDELKRNLKEKNAQIYIDRSKEMYEDRPPRKTLFLIFFKQIELSVLADDSLHGQENIISHMTTVDPDSPYPQNLEFTTLWGRMISGKFNFLKMLIRDYPQPLLSIESFTTRGMIIGSEVCGVESATRELNIEIGQPWKELTIVKNMPPLKFYYDLKWDMSSCQVSWGAHFEPTFAMVAQAFDILSNASIDPSPPLPFWDKMRLLFHGKLKADIADFNVLLSASTDPYNTTETLEIEWSAVTLEWTNGNISIDGDFDLFTRTASKYDDSKVIHFPDFKLGFQLEWLCAGDCNDHHNVYPTNPKYTDEEEHDSYAMFRSSNLNMNVSMEVSTDHSQTQLGDDPPHVFLYASTFRWFQNYQAVVISRVSRPIKRGPLFNNVKPRKLTLGRHFKLVGVDFKFPSLNVTYWGSFEQEVGFEITICSGLLSVAYQVFISPPEGMDLIRRPVANWIIRGLNSILEKTRVSLLQSTEKKLDAEFTEDELLCEEDESAVKKHYLFSVSKVEYQRQSAILEEAFTHKILLHCFKGAWTVINRELAVGLFAAYSKMQRLKKVLSAEALKSTSEINADSKRDKPANSSLLDTSATKSPLTRLQSGNGILLLEKLVSEQSSKFIAQSEEGESSDYDFEKTTDDEDVDIIQKNWHIELVNSQVLLHGKNTKGAIIVTSANATILKRLHLPICAATEVLTKLNKVTWCGKFRNLQHFSTVTNFKDITVDNIPWLTENVIVGESTEEKDDPHNISSYMKTSDAVGAFVDVNVLGETCQLQRVISRCGCEFRYVSLDDELDPVAEEYGPSTPQPSSEALTNKAEFASTLYLKHGKLEMSTSTTQYEVIADICQNLIFYTEPKKKKGQEKLEKMKFKLQLSTEQDLKGNILQLQNRVRQTLLKLRRYERNFFDYKRKVEEIKDSEENADLLLEIQEIIFDLQDQIEVTKEQLFEDVEELKILINVYKDVEQITSLTPSSQKGVSSLRKQIDVLFDDMQWLIVKQDGQLGIANVFIKKFKYNQFAYTDNSIEHCFEVGHFAVKNLLPNETYREALIPHEVNIRRHLDKSVMLRIFCRVSPPVAGIEVKEHFEVNVCPIAVRLTYKLFVNMESFLFPKPQQNETAEHEFQPGMQVQSSTMDYKKDTDSSEQSIAPFKIPPTRPPPPRLPPPRPAPPVMRGSIRRKTSATSMIVEGEAASNTKVKKNVPNLELPDQAISPPLLSPSAPPTLSRGTSFKRTSFKEVSLSASVSSADRDVNTMKERASKNHTFIYVKIPEVPVCFSYKGEKERNIEDAHDFNLCLPTLEYHSRTWTWQDLFQALKKDYTQTLVPQILKEKLHLKSAGADTKPSIAQVDDNNKAKLLFGEKPTTQKKSAKKLLFGKLLKAGKSSSNEKLNEQGGTSGASSSSESDPKQELMGRGIEPANLEHAFKRLRGTGPDNDKPVK